jgi:flagellar motor switch protein FliM
VSEPTLSLTLEARLAKSSSTVVLLVPHASVVSMLPTLGADETAGLAADSPLAVAVDAAVRHVDVVLRAEVAAVELTVEQVVGLRAGDLLRLESPAEAGATLYADAVPVCAVRLGRSGRRRAVQVVATEVAR